MDSSTSNDDDNKIEAENMIVLVKCDKENPELSDIYVNKNNYRIGRGRDCNFHILDVLISRNHCILTFNKKTEEWSITNLSSTGTTLNDNVLDKDKPYVIHIGDFIQFSVCHKFKFYVKEFIENGPVKKKQRIDESVFNEEIKRQKAFAEEQELKRKELEEQLVNRQKEQEDLKARLDEIMKTKQEAEGKSEEQNELIKQLEDKIKAGNEVETQLQQNYTQLMSTVEAQKQQFEQLLNAERAKWQQTLDMTKQEKEDMERKMLGDMAAWRLKQNAEWTTVVDELVKKEKDIQQKLVVEKASLEQRLQKAERALQEKTALAEQLQHTVQNQQVIVVEVASNGALGESLDTIDLTKDDVRPGSSKDNAVVDKVGSILDDQLTCQICSELFVTAVTLLCSHTYCQYCISMWMKKKRECPICRAEITTMSRSLALDNFIEQMVDELSTHHKERRRELVNQHKAACRAMGIGVIKHRKKVHKRST
ncbi:Similar to RNF8: E3 ubiquitin-protein ligase RNF8 (Homo sapiens) [Cotesia congregata]|uniref:E3 ubiquitin-protein ligase CHFR n=1 Tax=Cotesia congregata TaxID=51543 RepID=A0A8J2HUE1_COTCN|nr:Similar to RNF8: E3 ubiquitin-protein ligase RNF8 (Homo sapiens) [Cotesia congregata]